MSEKLAVVQWNRLEEHQQDLVISMLNNIHGLDKMDTINGAHFWITANVRHPSCGRNPDGTEPVTEPEVQIWDASFDRFNGQLRGMGHNGPSGQGKYNTIMFDLDITIELGGYVS